ncbi:MAG: decaprenyl-phosphate phosphoribosyltransferase [Actinomycetota bacterium]|nr:decaprenyl-phosphate phosphoribosyltransferase [Actinomycetota bacterium]
MKPVTRPAADALALSPSERSAGEPPVGEPPAGEPPAGELVAAEPPSDLATSSRILDWLRLARPKQWAKNVLVFVAPGAAGVLTHAGPALRSLGAFGVFCAAASATYLVNDTVDAEADRRHPTKRLRPVASGRVSPRAAIAAAMVLFAAALAGSALLAGWPLVVVVAAYAAITVSYSLRLKREPVIELTAVASGFVLRAVAGGVAAHVPLSRWFLVVTSFSALFLVIGKRTAEHQALGDARGLHRSALDLYSRTFLRSALTLSAAGAVTTYCLWAFDKGGLAHRGDHLVWIELSVAPVLTGVLYVLRLLDAGHGGAPSELAWEDRMLQVLALVWAVLVGVGIYA